MKTFPFDVKTKSGYHATVSNPSMGHYHFEFIEPNGQKAFDFYEEAHIPKGMQYAPGGGTVNTIHEEVLNAFHETQRQ